MTVYKTKVRKLNTNFVKDNLGPAIKVAYALRTTYLLWLLPWTPIGPEIEL